MILSVRSCRLPSRPSRPGRLGDRPFGARQDGADTATDLNAAAVSDSVEGEPAALANQHDRRSELEGSELGALVEPSRRVIRHAATLLAGHVGADGVVVRDADAADERRAYLDDGDAAGLGVVDVGDDPL